MLKPIYRGGLLIPSCGLWLDPKKPKDFAVVSHAHSDHVARHARYIATPETIALIRVRMGDTLASRGIALPYGEIHQGAGYRLRFYPAGHVLGSAMTWIENDRGDTLLYTGDFKIRSGLSCEPLQIVHADTLVMETTFGRPDYRFPSFAESCAQLHAFCDCATEAGKTAVLLAYSLGKAQEILKILESRSQPIMVHRTISEMNRVYSYYGVRLPITRPLDFLNMSDAVVVMPPSVLRQLPREDCVVAMVSGWAMDASARYRYGVDEEVPLSDHADHPELLHFVDHVSPQSVYTLHGYDKEFAADLRRQGYEAWSLSGDDQLELSL